MFFQIVACLLSVVEAFYAPTPTIQVGNSAIPRGVALNAEAWPFLRADPPFEIRAAVTATADPFNLVGGVYRRAPYLVEDRVAYERLDRRCRLYYQAMNKMWAFAPVERNDDGQTFYAILMDNAWMGAASQGLVPVPLELLVETLAPAKPKTRFDNTPMETPWFALGTRHWVPEDMLNHTAVDPGMTFQACAEGICEDRDAEQLCTAVGRAGCSHSQGKGVILHTAFLKNVVIATFLGQGWYRSSVVHLTDVDDLAVSAFKLVSKQNQRISGILCVPPKNGCTLWRRLAIRAQGFKHWNSSDPNKIHDPMMNGLGYMSSLTLRDAEQHWNNPALIKVFIARSPITRALSVFLSSRSLPQAVRRWPSFEAFVHWLVSSREAHDDPHTRPQSAFCDVRHGAHFDLLAKVEEREQWTGSLLEMLGVAGVAKRGWGADGRSAFHTEAASNAGGVQAVGHAEVGSSVRTHSDHKVCEYYRRDLLFAVARFYSEDLRLLRYFGEVAKWRRRCGF